MRQLSVSGPDSPRMVGVDDVRAPSHARFAWRHGSDISLVGADSRLLLNIGHANSDENHVKDSDQPASVDASIAVVVTLSPRERAARLVEGLSEGGFDVGWVPRIELAADTVAPDGVVVAIVDDADADWLRQVSDLLQVRPNVRLLALVDLESPAELLAALGAGVAGFVSPSADLDAIVRTVGELVSSGVALPRGAVPALVEEVRRGRGRTVQTATGSVSVTEREWEILQLLLQRRSTREISELLFVSVGTVRSHISALGRKLGAVRREDTIRILEQGMG